MNSEATTLSTAHLSISINLSVEFQQCPDRLSIISISFSHSQPVVVVSHPLPHPLCRCDTNEFNFEAIHISVLPYWPQAIFIF